MGPLLSLQQQNSQRHSSWACKAGRRMGTAGPSSSSALRKLLVRIVTSCPSSSWLVVWQHILAHADLPSIDRIAATTQPQIKFRPSSSGLWPLCLWVGNGLLVTRNSCTDLAIRLALSLPLVSSLLDRSAAPRSGAYILSHSLVVI